MCAAQREEGTDEEDDDPPEDFVGDRLAHARLEATGQLYREVRYTVWDRIGGLYRPHVKVSAIFDTCSWANCAFSFKTYHSVIPSIVLVVRVSVHIHVLVSSACGDLRFLLRPA